MFRGLFDHFLLRKVRSVFMDIRSGMSKFTQNEDFYCFVKAEYESEQQFTIQSEVHTYIRYGH